MIFFLSLFFLSILLFLFYSSNLLVSLLFLEIFGFFLILFLGVNFSSILSFDFLYLIIFSVFVIEGVMGLAGLVLLVSFTGSDYVNSSSVVHF